MGIPTPDKPLGERVELVPGLTVPAGLVGIRFARSGGPGGQHVNKVSTAVTLRVSVDDLARELNLSERITDRLRQLAGSRLTKADEIVLRCRSERSQLFNRRTCLERLGLLILEARTLPKKRRPTKPSRAAKQRRLDNKRKTSERKQRRNWNQEG